MKFQTILPVLISILIIIIVAIVQRYSRTAAGILAVMPVTAPLAIWVTYSANAGSNRVFQDFTLSLVLGILATVAFLLVTWLAARAGWTLVPSIMLGYLVWGISVGVVLILHRIYHF